MWKRILTLVTTIMAIALSVSVLRWLIIQVEAFEKDHDMVVCEMTEPEVKEAAMEESEETTPVYVEMVDASVEMQIEETTPVYIEKYSEVPLYNQLDYGTARYGNSTVRKSGCGIASYAMVLTYLLDREILPDELAGMYHRYKVEGGSSHCLFTDTQEEWGVTVQNCYWKEAWLDGKVMEALANGQPIIANVHKDSVFTDGGHFIVLYGLSEDGKILVRDPNGANYNVKGFLAEGFANGFEPEYFRKITANYFIYSAKDIDAIAAQVVANT